ncbi:hypothetical protein HZB02_01225 [Candidatus Woesearchaeota archaeon]|nr:hypothetical protein [Candidatus Woesearchaeota archaeon]
MVMNPLPFGVGMIAGGGLFYAGFRALWLKRLIDNLPTSKVRSLAMGIVEVKGKIVVKDSVLKSPFTNKNCVAYRYLIEEYRKTSKDTSSWVQIDRGEERTPFYVQDETGKVLVDPTGAEIDIPIDYEFQTGFGKTIPSVVQQFAQKKRVAVGTFLGMGRKLRFREYFIAPNDQLFILGTAGDNPQVTEGTAKKNEDDIMIQNGKPLFYISDQQENGIVNKFKWQAVGGIIGGSVLIVVCLALLLRQFGML